MSLTVLGLVGIGILLAMIFLLRIPVGFAMGIVGFCGFWAVLDVHAALGMLGDETWKVFSSYGLTVIPLFILMGQICFYSGLNERLYRTAYAWLGQVRGGVAMATVMACAGFAAISGSNTATAATMSSVALPQMKKYGYDSILSTGAVAAASTLGAVIPPSIVLIVIGLQTGQSIAKLFWASLIPGIMLVVFFLLRIAMVCKKNPAMGPAGPRTGWKEKFRSLKGSVEMIILFALVMGGLLAGFFTPSEAGAAGAALALLVSLGGRNLSWKHFVQSVQDTLGISCMIMTIVLGAVIFGRFLAVTRIPFTLATQVAELSLPPLMILGLICLLYMLGGAIMDALALLIITIPIFFPVAESLGYDPLWFAIVVTVVTTMGAVTPPVGVNTFIVSAMAGDVPLTDVFRGVALFLPCYLLCLAVLILWPGVLTLL
ncbi:MAG: TRAP transporter large permease [Desulfoplanes sp.]|nr:TRAP transporter large permease [Desulfoplanes sp.]